MTLSADQLTSRRRLRRAFVALFTIGVIWFALGGALPVGAQSPAPEPTPALSPAPGTTPGPTPGASAAPPAALPGGANSAVPQPACPLPAPTAIPTGTPAPTLAPGATPAPATPAPTAPPNALCPAIPSGNPVDLLAYLFNPIFQTMFLTMTVFYDLTGDIGFAIVILTLLIKTILIPLFRAQIVSQRRMQLIQPEVRAIQQKFKGNRQKISEETMRLYKERNVSLGSGCLPAFLQLFLLLPIYSVVSQGLAAPDISSALQFLGQPVLQDFACQLPGQLQPCINPTVWWLGNLDAHVPEILFKTPILDFGVSLLAIFAATLQLIQTRMMTPSTTDPQARAQQRIFLVLPLFSIIYGSFLPAGLFIYWIVFTAYSIVQQYMIVGWGSLFPLFGWTPGFAQNHTPRFPVQPPTAKPPSATSGESRATATPSRSTTDSAAGTIKPARQRGRTSRRGRRR
jgi:YidC/Oxa1 family membrane protein insertase